jgi:hypothetical protein
VRRPPTLLRALAGWLRRRPPRRRLADARPGEWIRARGRIAPRDLLDGPISGVRCVYYRYAVETWRRSAIGLLGGDGFWEAAEADEAITEFYLIEGDARVVVSPVGARVEPRSSREVVERDGVRRARELALAPGDLIEVTGRLVDAIDPFDEGRGYRADARCRALVEVSIRPLAQGK